MWRYIFLMLSIINSLQNNPSNPSEDKFIDLLHAVYHNKLIEEAKQGHLEGSLCSYIVWTQLLINKEFGMDLCEKNVQCEGWKSYHAFCSIIYYRLKDYKLSYLQFNQFMNSSKDLNCDIALFVGRAIMIPDYKREPLNDIIKSYQTYRLRYRYEKPYDACYFIHVSGLAAMKGDYKMPVFQWLKKYYADKVFKSAITMGPCLSARIYVTKNKNNLEIKNQCSQDAGWITADYISINKNFIKVGYINKMKIEGKKNFIRELGEGSAYYYLNIFHNSEEYHMEYLITNKN